MGKTTSVLRRSASMLAVAIAMMAITGPASAEEAGIAGMNILNGKADSQALRVKLTLPSVDQLQDTLAQLGIETPVEVPADVKALLADVPTTIEQVISLNHGEVLRADAEGNKDHASGFATSVIGDLIPEKTAESICVAGTDCSVGNSASTAAHQIDLPEGLGSIRVAGADSSSPSELETTNETALVKVDLDLKDLLATAGVSSQLHTLTDTINTMVLPQVNSALSLVEGTLGDALEQNAPAVKEQLDKIITLGTINDIPNLDEVSLLSLKVLDGTANVMPKTVDGVEGLLAQSTSKVADVKVLGDWATIEAVGTETNSFANGQASGAYATSDAQIAGLNLGGALGIDVSEDELREVLSGDYLKNTVEGLGADLEQDVTEVVRALDLLHGIAGISYEFFKEDSEFDDDGMWANASAGTLKLTVAPKIPVFNADELADLDDGIVPELGEDDYVATGLSLELELPNSSSAVVLGDVLSNCVGKCGPTSFVLPGRTGVGTPLLVGVLLLGMAVVVRRFAMTK